MKLRCSRLNSCDRFGWCCIAGSHLSPSANLVASPCRAVNTPTILRSGCGPIHGDGGKPDADALLQDGLVRRNDCILCSFPDRGSTSFTLTHTSNFRSSGFLLTKKF